MIVVISQQEEHFVNKVHILLYEYFFCVLRLKNIDFILTDFENVYRLLLITMIVLIAQQEEQVALGCLLLLFTSCSFTC